MNRRNIAKNSRIPQAVVPLLALLLDNCAGSSHTLPRQTPPGATLTPTTNAQIGVGNDANGVTEEDVRRIIAEIQQRGQTPNYVTVKVGSAMHYFSPNDIVAKTAQALIVQTPRRLYAWKLDREPTVRYSSWSRGITISELPYAPSKLIDDGLDAALHGKLQKNALAMHVCAECDLLYGRNRATATTTATPGTATTDPWQTTRHAAAGQRSTSTYIVCVYDVNGAHCTVYTDMGLYSIVAPQYYYDPSNTGTQIAVPPPPCSMNLPTQQLTKIFNDRPDIQAVAQAVASRNANHAAPRVVTQSPPAANANGAAGFASVSNQTITLFPDNWQPFFDNGMNLADMFLHELLHLWYETKDSSGHRANPLPNDPGFNAHPTVQLVGTGSNGAQTTITLQFDLIDSAGHFDATQYLAYEHTLIHDDILTGTGGDGAWSGLQDAMAGASSVRIGAGAASKVDKLTAYRIISNYNLKSAGIASRGPRRPPTWPDFNAGCTLNATSAQRQPAAQTRTLSAARRTSDVDNPIDRYNLDGYDLIWDGLPTPPPPPTCDRDALGYCSVILSIDQWVATCSDGSSSWALVRYHYLIYTPTGTARYTYEWQLQDAGAAGGGGCSASWVWTPGDPQYDFNDPYLV